MSPETASRLEALQIQIMVDAPAFCVLARGECIAVAPRTSDGGFASPGSTGMMTEAGLAYLVWREGRALLVAHGASEIPATPEQVDQIQRFSADLKTAVVL